MSDLSEMAEMVADIIRRRIPSLKHAFPRTYVVAAVGSDKRIDLRPPAGPSGLGLEPKKAVEQWGLGVVTPAVGTKVGVLFLDADERTAIIVPWGFGSRPVRIELDATTEIDLGTNPTRGAARLGDTVSAGAWTIAPGAGIVTFTYTPATGTPTVFTIAATALVATLVSGPMPFTQNGQITSASAKVKVE